MPSTYEAIVAALGQTFFMLTLLVVMVSVPWIGCMMEGWFGGHDDDEGDAA